MPFEAELRDPSKSELDFFKSNPLTSGMAAEDDRVVLNPFSELSDEERQGVVLNETSRIFMRTKDFRPEFSLTPRQMKQFESYGTKQDIRETIVGRILSGDPSISDATPQQVLFAGRLRKLMEE